MADMLPVFGDEDVMACQVLEIIGGITPKALQFLEEPCQETDVWSMEEGDDSVFYSDEDAPPQDTTMETRRLLNSEADEIPLGTEQETERQENEKEEPQTEVEHRSDESANPGAMISGILVSTCEEVLQLNSTDVLDLTPSWEITKEPGAPSQTGSAVHHRTQEVHPGPDFEEGCSIPTLSKKKSSHPKAFNHLTSSKYSTTSYRRIRRGNTRQRIEEFEYMIMNL